MSPKGADFCSCIDSKVIHLGSNRYEVISYVDALNAFGVPLRKNFSVIIKLNGKEWTDMNDWTLEAMNIQ